MSYVFAPCKASAVIIDTDININLKQLVRAEVMLGDPECLFIAGATDMVTPHIRPIMGNI